MAGVSLPAPGAGHRRHGAIINAADAATAAVFDEVREERDSARHCLTTALDDFHKVMGALDASQLPRLLNATPCARHSKRSRSSPFKFDRRPP